MPLCGLVQDTQSHPFSCKIILDKYPEVKKLKYEDIFSENMEKIKIIIEELYKILTYRETLLGI